ncbi:hypothetical protein BL131_00011035 [Klebsiella pneumoniae]|uniref:hypothetical protein n=1 Tax=Klebsiella pneumoniae complex TaxID=3390273 RepID=UPI0009368772|nr:MULTISPECIES: hypothetical protein [Klebsiella]MBD7149806.1 hypothetical protein [Klebsiella pneumoniae]MDP1297937.1 hypothetical protein [Klebsiella quasipneumoniae]RNO13227.1 hypothetical protein BL131_00011035 [Klebsiella pneumoniae]HBR0861764.1 hypothetical protein [Klebsiella pneumoniae]HCB1571947.1 hypothetical protein [Klebsiella quasipneumoniae]
MTDITELALIAIKNQIKSFDTVVLRENEALALVEALERAQETIAFQQGEIKALLSSLESRTVTVKLTDINEYLAEVHDKTLNRAFRLLAEGVRAGDVAAMRAAGIKVEAE